MDTPICKGEVRCLPMQMAIDGVNTKDKTGLVVGVFPPHLVAIRCKSSARGQYKNIILRLCPWCGAELPQGSVADGPDSLDGVLGVQS